MAEDEVSTVKMPGLEAVVEGGTERAHKAGGVILTFRNGAILSSHILPSEIFELAEALLEHAERASKFSPEQGD